MSKSIIAYDRELPEIPDRLPWVAPNSFLVRDIGEPSGWRVDTSGRRPSDRLLVAGLRKRVNDWRTAGYPGASDVTRRLFAYWFEEDHAIAGFAAPFRYYFCQREAIETLAYVVEIVGNQDAQELITQFAENRRFGLFDDSVEFSTTIDGQRQVRRVTKTGAGREQRVVQDLPPENLRRYAFKMATGSGKTWVMALAIVWSYFHRQKVAGSALSTNFLIVAPNVIVYQRLEKDFGSNKVFHELPIIPPEWRGSWNLKVILRSDSAEPDPSGNLFLTNIHQLYESRSQAWTPQNAVAALLGAPPANNATSQQRPMLDRIKSLRDLIVINDEAHRVHDDDLQWSKALLGIHRSLPSGLSMWLDLSATPKDQGGNYFPWIICDYPLAQAVEDRIVKAPLIVSYSSDPNRPLVDPEHVTKDNVVEKYGYWLRAAVARWKEHSKIYPHLGVKPVLFIATEKNLYADAIGEYLWKTKEFGFKEHEVKVIHTDTKGNVTQKDLEQAREAVRDVDSPESKIKVIVSVMMLQEGWDVRSVTVVLGLRPFTAKAEILPEQVIGRGLRLMRGIGPDRTQTLEVLGTRKLLDVLRNQLEDEGVSVGVVGTAPSLPITIEPERERLPYNIAIPITKPRLTHNVKKLVDLDPLKLDPIYEQLDLDERLRVVLRMEFATTNTEVHQEDLADGDLPMAQTLVASVTMKVIQLAHLANVFAELYPKVRAYIEQRCFGKTVDLEDEGLRGHLRRGELQEGIAKYLARKIGELTAEKRALEFANASFKLSDTKPFQWRRNLPPLQAARTVFNYVATYNNFERAFATFLDKASDVLRFAALGTTEQGESGTQFRIDYLKPSGAIGFYYPDWVVVQTTDQGEVNWIIETKGRVWEGTDVKDAAMSEWCNLVCEASGQVWRYARVNQTDFEARKPKTLEQAVTNPPLSPSLL